MDTTAIVHQPVLRFSTLSGPSNYSGHLGIKNSRVSLPPRNCFGKLSCQFSDSGHVQYYVSPRGGPKKKEKGGSCEIKAVKKKLKLIKRLSKNLSMFCHVADGEETMMGPEETLLLLARLRQLKLEQKELMRKMKEEKVQLKATSMKAKAKCESESSSSSSSSSESSDSECGEVINMNRLRTKTSALERIREAATVANPTMTIQQENSEEVLGIGDSSSEHSREDCCSRAQGECSSSKGCSNDQSNAIVEGASAKKIEICMGGKCKKLGAVALLKEFEKKVGVHGAVVGCKCMGKCRDGPNVRVSNLPKGIQAKSVGGSDIPPSNPLCIGVGLEDVDVIVANLLGNDRNDKCLMAPC